jgi:adenylate cyclase
MGSRQRFAYSALGDAVNLASRLEGQTKYYGVPIIIGETTQKAAEEFAVFELDYIKVQGKEKPVHIYGLYGDKAVAASDDFKSMHEKHMRMIDLYREGNFTKARDCLLLPYPAYLQKTYSLYASRIEHYIKSPPQNWQGVFEAESK